MQSVGLHLVVHDWHIDYISIYRYIAMGGFFPIRNRKHIHIHTHPQEDLFTHSFTITIQFC